MSDTLVVPDSIAGRADPLEVVIVGGGVAALEALLALRDLAGERVRLTLVAPQADFVYRPLSVGEPFAIASATRYPLAKVAADMRATFVRDAITAVDADAHLVHLRDGGELAYGALLLALGAHPERAYEHAITFGEDAEHEALHGLLVDAEQGYLRRIAFVVPPDTSWALPLYELAIMTAHQVWGMGIDDMQITFITPETRPMGILGADASQELAALLTRAHIRFIGGTHADVGRGEIVLLPGGRRLAVHRVVTLPRLVGLRLAGLPSDAEDFVWVNTHGEVVGMTDVYAAGDMTEFPIKQGGLAAQQADAAAETIAAAAGAPVDAAPFHPVLRGMLLLGSDRRFMRHGISGHAGDDNVTTTPLWWPPSKVASRYLAPYLFGEDQADQLHRPPDAHVPVEVPLDVPTRLPGEPDLTRAAVRTR